MSLSIKELSPAAFAPYGTYANMVSIESKPLADTGIIQFWPDAGGVLNLGPNSANQAAFGICRVVWRDMKVDVSEIHHTTGEGIMPLDGDIYLHVGPPTGDDAVPAEAIEIFRVPKGTMVVLKAGVWHHAPFAVEKGSTVSTLIVLPQRTYAIDCIVRDLEKPLAFG